MKSVILCEGADDLWVIAYYLNKKHGWDIVNPDGPSGNVRWSEFSTYGRLDKKKGTDRIFMQKDDDLLVIEAVGGKDSFKKPAKAYFNIFPEQNPLHAADNVIIVTDRDNDSIEDRLAEIEKWLDGNWKTEYVTFENNVKCDVLRKIDGVDVRIGILPLIIPFNEEGAIETILMNGIAELNDEDSYIVNEARKYIDSIRDSGKVTTYLNKERLILKAKYSAMIAVKNPSHSTRTFSEMMMSCKWEDSEYIDEHFAVIADTISQ